MLREGRGRPKQSTLLAILSERWTMMAEASPERGRRLFPETTLGKWSVVLFGVLVVGAAALIGAAASGQEGGDTLFDNLWLAVPGVVAIAAAAGSGGTGLYSILRRHERSRLVVVATALSTLVFAFVALDIIFGD